jgi:hypothetical protein
MKLPCGIVVGGDNIVEIEKEIVDELKLVDTRLDAAI